jgi:hypothetical protein
MPTVLVLANETIGGGKLLDAVRERGADGDTRFHVVVPQTKPRHGNVIYDEAVRDSAQVRVDPYNAAMDAVGHHRIDEILVSTLPATSSSWLRRDLPERLRVETGLPVEHIVVDLDAEGLPFDVTLVLANQTAAGRELVERLEQLAEEGPRRFIVVVPQDSGDGGAVRAARERLGRLLESLHQDGIVAAGMIGDPDPYTAARNALEYFHISELVVSTLPSNRSEWIEKGLIEKLERDSGKRVVHVESSAEPAGASA